MKRVLQALLISTAALTLAALTVPASMQAQAGGRKVRLGTYDNRAIAVAYFRWSKNPLSPKMAEHDEAKRAGDTARAEELEKWGQKEQRKAHRQGFCRAPVDDLLAQVRPGLAEVARARELEAITWSCDFKGPEVELVDVTDDLVRLFDPSAETLKTVRELRDHAPLDLDELDDDHDH